MLFFILSKIGMCAIVVSFHTDRWPMNYKTTVFDRSTTYGKFLFLLMYSKICMFGFKITVHFWGAFNILCWLLLQTSHYFIISSLYALFLCHRKLDILEQETLSKKHYICNIICKNRILCKIQWKSKRIIKTWFHLLFIFSYILKYIKHEKKR